MKRYIPITVAFLLGLLCGLAFGQSPASELKAALADLKTIPQVHHASTRYISGYNLNQDSDIATRTLNFVANSVSRAATLQQVTPVPGTRGRLLRFNLAAFGIPHGEWERLAESECYWHIKTEVLNQRTGKRQTVLTDGGWLPLEAAGELRQMTGSVGAIVRLDWLVSKLAQPPHYYAFANVPATSKEWYAALGADKSKIVQLRANHGANLFTSGVTKKPRRLSRYQGPLGGLWNTFDTLGDDPLHDPIRTPSFESGFDAQELIAAKANGLHLFGLYDGAGKRQDAVPDRIAKDDSDPHGDGRLIPFVSCVRCHAADSGLRSFQNDTADLLKSGVDILTGSPFDAESLASFYLSEKLQRDLQRDREDYAAAVGKCTDGWTPKQAAAALAELFAGYEYRQVRPADACRELGVRNLDALRSSRDGVLLALWAGKSVQRKQFEQSFAEAAVLCGGK